MAKMTKQELLKYDPKKSFRNDILAFLGFSAVVMLPLAWMFINKAIQ